MAEQRRETIREHFLSGAGPACSATRRVFMGRLGILLTGGLLTQATQRFAADAKRKKRRKKHQKDGGKGLKFTDWNGLWETELDNGVSGYVTLQYEPLLVRGTYNNTVGSGVLRCYTADDVKAACHGFYDQESDGSSGSISMTLQDKNQWSGTYKIDGGSSGTWSGTRIG